jgi:adenosylhomocysteine nucleosidase
MTSEAAAPVGVIAAIPEEMRHLRGARHAEADVAGQAFSRTDMDGLPVVLAETGIGKVNAAVTATLLVREFGCRALVFSGVAGGVDPALRVGDVVVASRLVQHDYGAVVDGALVPYQPGSVPLPGFDRTHGYDLDPALAGRLRAALDGVAFEPSPTGEEGGEGRRAPALVFGTVVTGDAFVNCEATRLRLAAEFGAAAVEMEGAAVAQVARRFGVPWVVVRCLSDLAGASSHLDFASFLPVAAANAARAVRRIVPVV